MCNANGEIKYFQVLNISPLLLDSLDTDQNKQLILVGRFSLFPDTTLAAKGVSPYLKNKSLAKVIKIKDCFDLCDIWRLRNADTSNLFSM